MAEEWDFDKTEESEEEERDVISYQISSYPADITLSGYLEKWDRGQLKIPDFQRNYVWDQVKASKLIESFLLGLPVPGVFLYKERATNHLAVIDGQQRITSAVYFFKNRFNEKIFRLKNVLPKWEGKTFDELDQSDQYQLSDTVLRATVVQQLDPADDSSIYHIFERLNTGGMNLNPMEIRKCVYFGEFMSLLEELNQNEDWRKIIAQPNTDKRFRDVELVLRVLALCGHLDRYEKPMKGFLNMYMSHFKKLEGDGLLIELTRIKELFESTCRLIAEILPDKPFHLRGRINYAAMDSIFATVANMSEIPKDLTQRYEALVQNDQYIQSATINTSDDRTLQTRFAIAKEILAG